MNTPEGSSVAPIWQPQYGASFGNAIGRFFKKYADFTGRASRSEYWWFFLFAILIAAMYQTLLLTFGAIGNGGRGLGPLGGLLIGIYVAWALTILVPSVALSWRRLHDVNLAGPYFFLGFIPLVGWIILLVFYLRPSKAEGARFDRCP